MVDIIYTSWIRSIERLAYLIVTHQSVVRHCRFRELPHKYHVCVENGSILKNSLEDFCQRENIEIHYKTTPATLASMMNYSNTIGENPFILLMQDDWFMVEPLDINKCIKLLDHKDRAILRLRNNNIQGEEIEQGVYMLDPTVRGYYYSDNPHIKKRYYHKFTGDFMETPIDGKDNARCENIMNSAAKKISDKHKILSLEDKFFIHIGNKNTTLTDKVFER